ncbi:unnamed protein product [Caenorhabditis bovis]|uniref:Calpain catalytic domain-containing protein n=1 Tax=Caenorhabditis bovis TaxID=2654633 RepID=A0A8S1F444_9PELO|nr:unnamed protein product [Caenorhabditis bovis]
MSSNSDSKAAVLSLKIHDSFRDAKFDKDFRTFENGPQPSPTVDKAKEEALERMRQLEGVVDTSIDTHPNKPTIRGRRQYDKPHGCYRLAIKAAGKFENDTWLTKNGNPFEWAVAYIPTDCEEITKILENGFEPGIGGNIVTPDAKTAAEFASDYMFNNINYKLFFQVRVRPDKIQLTKLRFQNFGQFWKKYENLDPTSIPQSSNHEQMCSEITSKIEIDLGKENNEIYRNIVEICTSLKTNFIDDSFLHNKSSIGIVNGVEINHDPDFLLWLRPTEINTNDGRQYQWTIYNNPVPWDIKKGNLMGNCWLMSEMALIAENQNIIAEILPRNEYSDIGVYQVKVCVEGQWKVIIVDDYFPCYPHTRTFGMAIGRRKQLWVPLIEKALAKAVGNYSKLYGASLTQGLSMLTGAACVNYNRPEQPADFDTFWAQLVSSKESGFLMCCVCGGRETTDELDYELQVEMANHAYSILDVVTVHNHRLLRIRNPWGSFVWNGKWSDSWPHWPPDLKRILLIDRKQEIGAFWIELDDFISLFSLVTVCKVNSNWSALRFSQELNDNESKILQFNVIQTCEVSFMIFQKGSVGMDHEKAVRNLGT